MRNAIVMAAGKGTRMHSETSKIMHPILDRPMLGYTLDALKQVHADRVIVIVGYQRDSIMQAYPGLEYAVQEPQLGTGHAVMQASALENEDGMTLILNGDVPLIQPETLEELYAAAAEADGAVLTSVVEDGAHYGRIIRNADGEVIAIVEAKDCSEEQKKIREINTGIYCFDNKALFAGLKKLTNDNAQHEYYLPDLVKIFTSEGKKIAGVPVKDRVETAGINDCAELAEAEEWMRNRINLKHMKNGVQLHDPKRTVIGPDVIIGHDVIIHPDTEILGVSRLGDYCEVFSGTSIRDSQLGNHSSARLCIIEESQIKDGEQVQPFTIRRKSVEEEITK